MVTDHAVTRSETVRQVNLSTVLSSLHLRGASTRSDLVAETGLTRSAVAAIVGDLVRLDLVEERRSEPDGRPGRPSPIVATTDRHVVLGMEVLVDSVAVGVFGLGGTCLGVVRAPRALKASPTDAIAEVVRLAGQLVAALPTDTILHGVGIAVAGVVREADDVVMVAPNLGWEAAPVGALLRAEIGMDVPVTVANDGDVGALAESRRGVAAGMSDMVYISGEVGIGGGMIVDGRPLRGAGGFGGEVGHMPVAVDGHPCRCGSTGCWETEIGEGALLRRLGRPETETRSSLDAIIAAADAGDPATLAALADHGRWIGFGLTGIINVFDPELIVLGGFLVPLHPHLAESLDRELKRRVFGTVRVPVQVRPSKFTSGAPLTGAAERAWDFVLQDPAAAARGVAVGNVGSLAP